MKGDKLVGKYYVAFDQAYKAEVAELVEGGMAKEEAERAAPILSKRRRRSDAGKTETPTRWLCGRP